MPFSTAPVGADAYSREWKSFYGAPLQNPRPDLGHCLRAVRVVRTRHHRRPGRRMVPRGRPRRASDPADDRDAVEGRRGEKTARAPGPARLGRGAGCDAHGQRQRVMVVMQTWFADPAPNGNRLAGVHSGTRAQPLPLYDRPRRPSSSQRTSE